MRQRSNRVAGWHQSNLDGQPGLATPRPPWIGAHVSPASRYGALIIVGLWIVVALSDRLGWPTGGWKVLFLWLALCATMLAITRLWWNIRSEERWQLLRTMVTWSLWRGISDRCPPTRSHNGNVSAAPNARLAPCRNEVTP